MRLISAIWEARHTVRVHRVYQAQSRRREVAWKAKQILSTATEEVDAASVAIRQMSDALAAEEQIMREAIAEEEEERKVMDLLEIAQRVAGDLDDIGIQLAEAAAVLQLHQQPTAAAAQEAEEVMDPRGIAQQVAHDLAQIRNRLCVAVFSKVPVLPGAMGAAMDLVAGVCALPPPVIGTLRNAHRLLGVVVNDHDKARDRFVDCAPELGIQERGETWLKWSIHRHRAFVKEVTAETWLSSAISEAQIAVRQHRIYKEHPSLSPGERSRETWKVEELVSTAINEVDAALGAIRQMRDALAAEEQTVREAIDDADP
uniref:Uncharacterized protein n=1 Tax=Oryza punctata TaxID=4537 RepID=A0A0E0KF45_ORYPU